MADKKIECPCGWSRRVASTVRRERRVQILREHQQSHAPKIESDEQ